VEQRTQSAFPILKSIPTHGLTYDDRDTVFRLLRHVAERELPQHVADGVSRRS